MDEEDRAAAWAVRRRQRNFLVSGTVLVAIALVCFVATVLGVQWAAGFFGGSGVTGAVLLWMWSRERQATRDGAASSHK